MGESSLVFFCLLCFLSIMLTPFIVCDLYFAYGTDACLSEPIVNYQISFDLQTWLLVEGYGNLSVIGLLLLVAVVSFFSEGLAVGLLNFSMRLIEIYYIFRIAWLIVGAFIFWGQLEPNGTCGSSLNSYMWALLIINFIGTFCNIIGGNRARNQNELNQNA